MPNQLFSTYSQGENRVTASILAVFERVSFALLERILQALCQEPETALVTFSNQLVNPESIPDGRIRGSFAYWIETKTTANMVRLCQIQNHLMAIEADQTVERKRLIVLTPDSHIPPELGRLNDPRVAWASFDNLVAAIQDAVDLPQDWLTSDRPLTTESESALLRELVRFLVAERLVGRAGDLAVVVPARIALDEYERYDAYICQANRPFQMVSRIAFYTKYRIYCKVPKVLHVVNAVELSHAGIDGASDLAAEVKGALHALVDKLEQARSPRAGDIEKVFLLSPPDSLETLNLPHDIENDSVDRSGRPTAFVQNQRYVPVSRLKKGPRTTSELLDDAGS